MRLQDNRALERGNKKPKKVYQCDAHLDGVRCQRDGVNQVSTAYHFCEVHTELYDDGSEMGVQAGQTIRKVLNLGKRSTPDL